MVLRLDFPVRRVVQALELWLAGLALPLLVLLLLLTSVVIPMLLLLPEALGCDATGEAPVLVGLPVIPAACWCHQSSLKGVGRRELGREVEPCRGCQWLS